MADFPLYGGVAEIVDSGFVSGTTLGTAVTANASANTKGAWAEIVASSPGANGFILTVGGAAITVNADYLLDIAIGALPNEEIILPDYLFSMSANNDTSHLDEIPIPVEIPAGTRISARVQSTTGSDVINVMIYSSDSSFITPLTGQEIITFGANSADSGGAQVDPGGTLNTKGSWSEIVASTSDDIIGFMVSAGMQANTNMRFINHAYDVGIGASPNEEVIVSNYRLITNADIRHNPLFHGIPIPAGSRLAIRSQVSDSNNPDRLLDYVIHGLK